MTGKRIEQKVMDDGTVSTRTRGTPQGDLTNFDVSLTTRPTHHKKATEFVVELSEHVKLELTGRQAKTLREVLNRHFETVDDVNW